MRSRRNRFLMMIYGGLSLWLAAFAVNAADSFAWNTNKNRVTADVRGLALTNLLERVAAETGWQVFVEPGTFHKSSAKFKDLSSGDALRMLLGDLNFALAPETNAVSRLYVFRTAMNNATQQISPARLKGGAKSKRLTNELIVQLKPGVNIDELAKALGAKVVGRIPELNTYRLQFEDAAAADAALNQLASNPDVATVDYNYYVDRPMVPEGVTSASATLPQLQFQPDTGCGNVVVGVIDTAVQPMGNNLDSFISKRISVAGDAPANSDTPMHGTMMVQDIMNSLQAATKGNTSVSFVSVDVFGGNEGTSTFNVAAGIVQAVNNGANWLNVSLGSSGNSTLLQNVIKSVTDHGIAVFAAAGNEPTGQPVYPAAYPGVTAVTALNRGQIASYANMADFVRVAAPGGSLNSFNGRTYYAQGTSVSTAYTTGAAVGMADANCMTWGQVQPVLLQKFAVPGAVKK